LVVSVNKIGIRAHDLGKFNIKGLSEEVKNNNFEGVQLVFKKALSEQIDFSDVSNLKENFEPEIFMLGAYFNPIHPDKKVVTDGILNFKNHLNIAGELNAKFVGSETGSLMGSPWGYMPENHTQESLDIVTEIFKDLTVHAEKQNAYIALEGAWAHVASTPKRVLEMVETINSPHLKVTVDLYNFLNIENYVNRMDIFQESLDLLSEHIVIFHLKDFIVENGKLKQVGLGQGLMDYPKIINLIKEYNPNAYLIFEGVVGEDIKTSFELINNLINGGRN